MTDLINAAIDNNIATVKKLIDNGANVNYIDSDGWTALMVAARKGHTEITQLLIESGANVERTDKYGETPLMAATHNWNTDIAKLLIESGANVNQTDKYDQTALLWASRLGRTDIAKLLIENGANVNQTNIHGDTALMVAARKGHTDIAKLLIEGGAKEIIINETYNRIGILMKSPDNTKPLDLYLGFLDYARNSPRYKEKLNVWQEIYERCEEIGTDQERLDAFMESVDQNTTSVDLSALNKITSVGHDFLYSCYNLTSLDLSPLKKVTSLGNGFLSFCYNLTSLDLTPLKNVTSVGHDFLSYCKNLKIPRNKIPDNLIDYVPASMIICEIDPPVTNKDLINALLNSLEILLDYPDCDPQHAKNFVKIIKKEVNKK